MMFTQEEADVIRTVLQNAMAEVDASAQPDAMIQPDDPFALMRHYDVARRVIAKLAFDSQTVTPRRGDVLVHKGESLDASFFTGPFKIIERGGDLVVLCDGGGEIQMPNAAVFVEPERH